MLHLAVTTYRDFQMPSGTPFKACPDNAVAALHVSGVEGDQQLCVIDDTIAPVDADDLIVASYEKGVSPIDLSLTTKARTAMAERLKLLPPVSINTIGSMITWMFTDGSDRDGINGVRPLQVQKHRDGSYGLRFKLGRHEWRRPIVKGDTTSPDLIRTMELRRADLVNVADAEQRAKQLAMLLREHGLPETQDAANVIVGIDLKPIKPSTTIGDTFTDTDGTAIASHVATGTGGGWNWVNKDTTGWTIQGNAARTSGGADRVILADSALSSSDNDSGADWTANSSGAWGAAVRMNASDKAMYTAGPIFGINTNRFYRRAAAGGFTQIGSATAPTHSLPDNIELTVVGSTLSLYINGALWDDETDTNISTGVYVGIHGTGAGGSTTTVDNWVGTDNASPAAAQNYLTLLGVG